MGVWDALGRGIESGVSAFLQGQEQQLRRKREEEERAQREKEWLLTKMRGEAGLSMAERQFGFEQEQAKALTAEQLRRSQEATTAAGTEFEREKELTRLRASLETGREKEKVKDLYSPQGFNGEVALWLAMGNLGIQTDLELDQLLNGPQGQAMATGLVNRLVSVHGERWPGRNLAGDFWQFLKARNPKLQSPADVMASEAARAQAQAQQGAARTAQQAEQARLAPIAAVQTQQAAQRGLAAGGVPVPIAAGMPVAMQANVQPFTQDDLAKLRMYDEAPEMTKPMMKNVEPFRSLLMRRGR